MGGRFSRPLADKLEPLFRFKYLDDLVKIHPQTYYPVKHWTPLKLACLASYLHTCFIPIQGKRKLKKGLKIYFIDLLSNSGINKIDYCKTCDLEENSKECLRKKCRARQFHKDPFIGSPIVAAIADIPFNRMFFVDKEREELAALEKRLKFLKQKEEYKKINYRVFPGDCNQVLDDILDEIDSRFYSILAFVDNAGLNVTWNTISKLAGKYSDIIINFPTAEIKREFGAAKSGREHQRLDAFFGETDIIEKCKEDDLLPFYIKKIRDMGRPAWAIDIKAGGSSFHYHLIITVKKEKPGFVKFIEGIKKFESYDSKNIEKDIALVLGRAKSLSHFSEIKKKAKTLWDFIPKKE